MSAEHANIHSKVAFNLFAVCVGIGTPVDLLRDSRDVAQQIGLID